MYRPLEDDIVLYRVLEDNIEDTSIAAVVRETNKRIKAFSYYAKKAAAPAATPHDLAKALLFYSTCFDSLQSLWNHESYKSWSFRQDSKKQLLVVLQGIDGLGTQLPKKDLPPKYRRLLEGLLKANIGLIKTIHTSTKPAEVPQPPSPPPKSNPAPPPNPFDEEDEEGWSPCCKCVIS